MCEEVAVGAEHLYNLIVSSTQSSDGLLPIAAKSWSYRIQEKDEDARRTVMKLVQKV